jgi:hypothetical protein
MHVYVRVTEKYECMRGYTERRVCMSTCTYAARSRAVTATENTFCNTLWRDFHYQCGDADTETSFEILQRLGRERGVV